MVIVLGGSIGAVLLQTPMRIFMRSMRMLGTVFIPPKRGLEETIAKLVGWSKVARKDGLLGLERVIERESDLFAQLLLPYRNRRNPEATAEAIAGLDEGLSSRGFDIAITLRCIDLETRSGRYEDALDRLSGLETYLDRHEELLARRGDILFRAGRPLEAEVAYSEALGAVESLPPSRRSSPATQRYQTVAHRPGAAQVHARNQLAASRNSQRLAGQAGARHGAGGGGRIGPLPSPGQRAAGLPGP